MLANFYRAGISRLSFCVREFCDVEHLYREGDIQRDPASTNRTNDRHFWRCLPSSPRYNAEYIRLKTYDTSPLIVRLENTM